MSIGEAVSVLSICFSILGAAGGIVWRLSKMHTKLDMVVARMDVFARNLEDHSHKCDGDRIAFGVEIRHVQERVEKLEEWMS